MRAEVAPSAVDHLILAIYFVVVLGIGLVARLAIKTDLDFFLSGRSLPAWITGLAFSPRTYLLQSCGNGDLDARQGA